MDRPLDDVIIAISDWQHVKYLLAAYLALFFIGVLVSLFYFFVAIKMWFSYVRDAWKNKRSWSRDLRNSLEFLKVMLKGSLVWLIAGWPLVLVMTGLASAEALNVLFGAEVIFYPDLPDK
jgi:hypothetical protein